MSKIKQEMEARCEVAMMTGDVVLTKDNGTLETMVEYCMTVMSPNEVDNEQLGKLYQLCKEYKTIGFCCSRLQGMPCITVLLQDEELGYNPVPDNMSDNVGDNYQLCYVFNLEVPMFSEYGDCFFEKRPSGTIHRVS